MLRLTSRLRNTAMKVLFFVKRSRPKPKSRPKPVRTPKNPVRVVFVCPFGGSSNALSKTFSVALGKRGIKSVVSTFFSYEGKTAYELKRLLANADFVIPRSDIMVSGRQFRVVAPKKSKVLHSYTNKIITSSPSNAQVLRPMSLEVEIETDRILKAIRKRFELKP